MGAPRDSHGEPRWHDIITAAADEAAAMGARGFTAGVVELGGATWSARSWAPQVCLTPVDIAASRGLLGWVAAPEAAGAFAAAPLRGGTGHVVMRDGTSASVPGDDPVLWMLRRSVGLPSQATCKEPGDVAVARLAAALVEVARDRPGAVRDAAVTGSVRDLALGAAQLGDLGQALDGGTGWEQLRVRASCTAALARWCDADLYGFLAGRGARDLRFWADELGGLVGHEVAVLVADQLALPW